MKNKLFTVILITLATMLVFPIAVSAASETQTYPQYISAIELVAISRDDESATRDRAIEAINEKGYEYYLDYDFNKYSLGDYVMLGYSRTDDESKAIRSLVTKFVARGETPPETYTVDGIEYTLASNTEFNSGTDHDQVYLYITMNPEAGSPLKELYTEDEYIEPGSDGYMRILVNAEDNKAELDYLTDLCDGGNEGYCYLYRDYDSEYYANKMGGEDDAVMNTVTENADGLGSMFNDNSTVVVIIAIALVLLAGGAAVIIIVKRKRNKGIENNIKEN